MNQSTAPIPIRLHVVLFMIGCGALLVPIWSVGHLPLLDYPNHLASSFVLAHLHDPRFRFPELYDADWALSPYVATDAILVVLQRLLPVETAGRIVLSICALSLPLSVWFFARVVHAKYDLNVPWAFVLAYNLFFVLGFVEYCFSIAGCFAVLGLWLQYLDRPSTLRWMAVLVAVGTLYLLHLVGFAVAGLIITVYALVTRQPLRQLGLSWLVFVPGLCLLLRTQTATNMPHRILFGSLARKPEWVLAVLEVHPRQFEPMNLLVFALFAVAIMVAMWKNTTLRWDRDWLRVVLALVVAYCLLPSGYAHGASAFYGIDSRLLPFLFILSLTAVDMGHRGRWFATVTILMFVVRMGSLTANFLAEQPHLTRLAQSFAIVHANARVLPMVLGQKGNLPALLFERRNFWAYGIIRDGWLAPYLFAMPHVQTLRYRGEVRPSTGQFWTPEDEGTSRDWERLPTTYDYVWAYRVPFLSRRLHTIGDVVFTDEGLEIYKIRSTQDAGSPRTDSPPPDLK